MADNIYGFEAVDIDGKKVSMDKYKGKVVMIVNVASKCGFTKQYHDLQPLFEKHKDSGFAIAGFPCNQFGSQEPGDSCSIKSFAQNDYNITFDMYEKVNVNGDEAHPLWNYLKDKQGGFLGKGIKWNFTKFLIDRNGQPIKRYSPTTNPKDCEKDVEKALGDSTKM